ncbi:MAG: hypothetical protein ACYS8W_03550 [Planctomycetota bacterium]|jgi:Zn finger protein HypA/HybF involved in hydrogenase expression
MEKFHCLRCNYKYTAKFSKKEWPKELTCPKCKSNSVRWLKKRASATGEKK